MAAVASRYARALTDVVTGPKPLEQPDIIDRQLSSFLELIEESVALRNLLESPAVRAARKKEVIKTLGARLELSRTAQNVLFLLVDHRRMAQLKAILTQFRAMVDEHMGLVQARVTSAQPLSDADRAGLEAALAGKTGRRVRASYDVDPSLIGGVVTRVGSTIYDGSVVEQLRLLREKLAT
jgi:F-type H+-transporting ATPase subunit delta